MPGKRTIVVSIGVMLAMTVTLLISSVQAQQLVPLPAPGARATTELLTNGSFETDSEGDKIPDGWTGGNLRWTQNSLGEFTSYKYDGQGRLLTTRRGLNTDPES
ncbi:MAG: hypothetical protein H7Y11_11285 [Armatimonadetes bacterium]|nr:hypothetical protein [Anaerolineae bacterium]